MTLFKRKYTCTPLTQTHMATAQSIFTILSSDAVRETNSHTVNQYIMYSNDLLTQRMWSATLLSHALAMIVQSHRNSSSSSSSVACNHVGRTITLFSTLFVYFFFLFCAHLCSLFASLQKIIFLFHSHFRFHRNAKNVCTTIMTMICEIFFLQRFALRCLLTPIVNIPFRKSIQFHIYMTSAHHQIETLSLLKWDARVRGPAPHMRRWHEQTQNANAI